VAASAEKPDYLGNKRLFRGLIPEDIALPNITLDMWKDCGLVVKDDGNLTPDEIISTVESKRCVSTARLSFENLPLFLSRCPDAGYSSILVLASASGFAEKCTIDNLPKHKDIKIVLAGPEELKKYFGPQLLDYFSGESSTL